MTRKRLQRTLEGISIPVLAVLLGLLAASVFVIIAGANPIDTYQNLFCEGFGARGCASFGDLLFMQVTPEDAEVPQTVFAPFYGDGGHQLALVLEQATPLILTALSAAVAFKAGMFSIGMDGQFVLGAIVAVFMGYALPDQIYAATGVADWDAAPETMQTIMHLVIPIICMAAAMAVGAFYSWIAGYLRVKINVNVLISTIILNAIATQLVGYLVNFPLRSDMNNIARTYPIDDSAWLVPFNRGLFSEVDWFSGGRVGPGLIIALIAAAAVWFYLWRTTPGYEQRMAGGSSLFARFSGIPNEKAALRAMKISGALSGLAGSLVILGVERRVVDGFAMGGTGFDGVMVAVLAKEAIFGILFVAPLFAGLDVGSLNLQFGNLPRQLGGIIISFIILFAAMEDFLLLQITRITRRFQRRRHDADLAESPTGAVS